MLFFRKKTGHIFSETLSKILVFFRNHNEIYSLGKYDLKLAIALTDT